MRGHDKNAWENETGDNWAKAAIFMEAVLEPVRDLVLTAAAIQPGERVLDIGCGTGPTTLSAAREAGPNGSAIGVDVSPKLVEMAISKARASDTGPQVTFEVADAQTWRTDDPVDLVISRFGVMFFDDPIAAFTNIRQNVKPGGRLAFVVWREAKEAEMFTFTQKVIDPFLAEPLQPPADPYAPGPNSLFDKPRTIDLFELAGWMDVTMEAVDIDLIASRQAAVEFYDFSPAPNILEQQGIDEAPVKEAWEKAVDEKIAKDGVFALHSGVWVVRART